MQRWSSGGNVPALGTRKSSRCEGRSCRLLPCSLVPSFPHAKYWIFFFFSVLLAPKMKNLFYSKKKKKSSLKWLLVLWLPLEFFGKLLRKTPHLHKQTQLSLPLLCSHVPGYFLFNWEATEIYTACISVFLNSQILSSHALSLLFLHPSPWVRETGLVHRTLPEQMVPMCPACPRLTQRPG